MTKCRQKRLQLSRRSKAVDGAVYLGGMIFRKVRLAVSYPQPFVVLAVANEHLAWDDCFVQRKSSRGAGGKVAVG